MVNKDCFAYGTESHCRILKEVICKNGTCSFYKTSQQFHRELGLYPPIDYMKYKETGKKVILKRRK